MSDLEKLAGRVEALTGPDREVDALIAVLQNLRIVDEGHPLGRCCYDKNGVLLVLPSYTRSLDAAMSLVPDGWDFTVGVCDKGAWSDVSPSEQPYDVADEVFAQGATPALALCAAALRARTPIPSSRREGGEF